MITIERRTPDDAQATERLVLPFELRSKSRQRARLEGGEEVGLFLERGTVLRGGDRLLTGDGRVVEVVAAAEPVLEVRSDDPLLLARAAYHLGNRHVAVELRAGLVRFGHDHVLAEMVRGLGLTVTEADAPFEPEGGAYGHGGHSHGHDDEGRGPHIHEMGHHHGHPM